MDKGLAALAALGLIAGQARAGCWSEAELAAARVRDMQSRLMVATLRCQAARIDISTDYNAFVRANRTGIEARNLSLKAHFWADGPVEGQRAYDRFTTRLANAYGAGDTGPESCGEAAALARAAVEPGMLDALADRTSIMPDLERERCAPGGALVVAAR